MSHSKHTVFFKKKGDLWFITDTANTILAYWNQKVPFFIVMDWARALRGKNTVHLKGGSAIQKELDFVL